MEEWSNYGYSIEYLLEQIGGLFSKIFYGIFGGKVINLFMEENLAIKIAVGFTAITVLCALFSMINKKRKKEAVFDLKVYLSYILYFLVALYVEGNCLMAIGGDTFTVFYIMIVILIPVVLVSKFYEEKNKRIMAETIISKEAEYIENLKNNYDEIRRMSHDLDSHINTIEQLIEEKKIEEAENYTRLLKSEKESENVEVNTGNKYVDAIISEYVKICKENDIDFKYKIEGTIKEINDILNVSVFLNNSLKNAYETCFKVKENGIKDTEIFLNIVVRGDICIIIKNSCDKEIVKRYGNATTKKDKAKHGIGIKSMEAAIKKLDGYLRWYIDDVKNEYVLMASINNKQ